MEKTKAQQPKAIEHQEVKIKKMALITKRDIEQAVRREKLARFEERQSAREQRAANRENRRIVSEGRGIRTRSDKFVNYLTKKSSAPKTRNLTWRL